MNRLELKRRRLKKLPESRKRDSSVRKPPLRLLKESLRREMLLEPPRML